MRVLILLRDGSPNGITTYNRTLSQALRALGHAVCASPALEADADTDVASWRLRLRHPWAEPLVRTAVAQWQPDLIFVSHFTQARLAHRLRQTLGIPWFACMHNGHGESRMRAWSQLLANASGVVTLCDTLHRVYEPLAQALPAPVPMCLSRLPLNLPLNSPEHRAADGPLTLTYCARLSSQKGPRCEAWLRAIASLPRLRAHRLLVIGGGSHLPRLRRVAVELGLVVEFVGLVADPAPHLGRTDVITGAGYALMEGLVRGAVGVGLGFGGCWGAITPAGLSAALDVNFGDHSPIPLPHDPATIAQALSQALDSVGTADAVAVTEACRRCFEPKAIAADLVRFWSAAITPADGGVEGRSLHGLLPS